MVLSCFLFIKKEYFWHGNDFDVEFSLDKDRVFEIYFSITDKCSYDLYLGVEDELFPLVIDKDDLSLGLIQKNPFDVGVRVFKKNGGILDEYYLSKDPFVLKNRSLGYSFYSPGDLKLYSGEYKVVFFNFNDEFFPVDRLYKLKVMHNPKMKC